MALMRMRITPVEGDPVDVPITPKVIVAAERHFKTTMMKLFSAESLSLEAMAWIAWTALQAAGHTVKTFDLWLDGVASIDNVEDSSAPLGGGV